MDWFAAMMAWLRENAAVLSAVVVPVFLGVIGPMRAREAGGRFYRRVRRLAQLRPLLSDGSSAADRLDELLDSEVEKLAKRHARKLNGANLAAIIFVSLVGGAISFGLVTWAQAITGPGAAVVWVLFWLWSFLVAVFVLVGGSQSLYKVEED
ncbi:hypothetical protein H9651_04275 [Microbacterium sp. Sa4CUA7]|uniref:Uncharacterized protein n=1 Tax=Microbacterium pullorum TaxID=2762236 RepID=A0ABR8S023_9MICO|nr:hypothetical protein [Microbacterium pullorum]MBD7956842.1 hypothetical protein [Microbacterium pullorum]